ncbi:MAG: HIT family protein [Rhodospirillales bacterium]|nr:HIT family protein [Rhodospirillales bacterium]MCW8862383.1 HIT family protein [Rhodospirillales bacterium]MCW8951367.1 HIT family protein [Rhodospirillales bacterium]MCW8970435.1 HIT family protein [Rhodospirillales bacterium]MCW9001275.1 HIT family protein [Rhodospirillales bacterium]
MSHDPDCIFCKIIKGEIPCFKLYEDERTLSFMDINPVNPGHALIIPKFHTPNFFEIPLDWLADTMTTTQKIARAVQKTLEPHGLNILQANGPGAAQSVFHLHMHVVPRGEDDGVTMNWGIRPGNMDEIGALSERIRANIA